LARGYLNRPDLTAEKFVPNPHGPEPGSRMYRTGDLARYLPDGDIEYLGRMDDQMKLHGYRIEPGEIEAALTAMSGVREAVVVALSDQSGDKRLVAYIVMDEAPGRDGEDAVAGLRSALRQSLPDYMVPSHFMVLEGLPLNANGKVDRKALPTPAGTAFSAQSYVAPQTPIEEAVAQIWCEVLGLDRVGVTDDFFDLGGHSLQATRVVSRIEDLLGVTLPLKTMFDAPTIEKILDHIFAEFENSESS
jgi:acyl carrier protein